MTPDQGTDIPAKCRHCEQPLASPPVCDFCHTLNPIPAVTDYFSLLDLPRRFDIDPAELQRRFLALNRHTHPDFHAGESAEVQDLSLRLSAAINDAYRTLKDPAERGAYLLELLGGKSSADDKSVPDGFLGTMMMMQEELADAKGAGNHAELARLRNVLRTQHDGLLRRITTFFKEHAESVACEAVRMDLLTEIRKQLNAVSYVKKLLSQL